MRPNKIWLIALLCLFLAGFPGWDAKAEPSSAQPTEQDPLGIVRQMCDYLRSLKQFSYRAEVTDDQVYQGGKKLQYGIDMETFVKRPDRLRVNAEGDLVDKQFFFNGKTITLYDKDKKVYAVMGVPDNIEDALDKAHKDFGLKVALTDLASPKLWDHISGKVEHSLYVGMSRVRGVVCHHLAFDNADVHLQVWIDAGRNPLPVKVVFLQKKLEGSPQWTAYLSGWKTGPQLKDTLFNFVPPSGVQKIKFAPLPQPAAPGGDKGGKS
jgi:hypothetical protein